MATNNREARLAYELWEKMSQLESILWSKYEEHLLDFIMDEEEKKYLDNLHDDNGDDAPF